MFFEFDDHLTLFFFSSFIVAGNFPVKDWTSAKNPIKWAADAKLKLANAATELQNLRDLLGRVHNAVAEVKADKSKQERFLRRLQDEKSRLEANVASLESDISRLNKECSVIASETEEMTQLKETYTELHKLAEEEKSTVEHEMTSCRAVVGELKVFAEDHAREKRTLDAALSELRRDVLPRYRLHHSILGTYGGMALLEQPLATMNHMQLVLGNFPL